MSDPVVYHSDIQSPKVGDGVVYQSSALVMPRGIIRDSFGNAPESDDLIANPLDFRSRPTANDDLCAMLRKPPRDTGAEAGSATCDDCHLAASFLAYDGLVAYGASKGGVDQLCRQLGGEWAPDGIRVNAIGPGYMNSHMRGVETTYEDPSYKNELMRLIPMRRRGDPHELVGAVAFFLSNSSSYVTGQYLAIDGGFSLF